MKSLLRRIFNKITLERFPGIFRPHSLPYISGDTFRNYSKYVFDEVKTFNPKDVKKNDVVFVNSELVELYFKIQNPKIVNKYILISHNSDKSLSKKDLNLKNENIIHWFAQNLEVESSDAFSLIPIGIENKRWLRYGLNQRFKIKNNKTKFIIASFNEFNNYEERAKVLKLVSKNDLIDNLKFKDASSYFSNVSKYKFVLCPAGNGPDTHRIWESLLLKSFPIIELNSFTSNLKKIGVPGIYLNSWDDLVKYTKDDLNKEYANLSKENLDFLYFDYWKKEIESKFL
ncbi:MAG: hypothetical protein CL470_08930 [Acidimicrobiaceae bacterium]|nr:hypothetical protein [Acidimicrobiaceae bacterium]|tara:strand:- start:168 stop:1025 length:858 start_codon:yes stop_codon:yes gene_type:complete